MGRIGINIFGIEVLGLTVGEGKTSTLAEDAAKTKDAVQSAINRAAQRVAEATQPSDNGEEG